MYGEEWPRECLKLRHFLRQHFEHDHWILVIRGCVRLHRSGHRTEPARSQDVGALGWTSCQVEGPAPTASARASAASSGTALSGMDSNDKSCKLFRFEQLENRELTLEMFVYVPEEFIDTG